MSFRRLFDCRKEDLRVVAPEATAQRAAPRKFKGRKSKLGTTHQTS
jgi:hypothetical protein